jgi:phosphatidate cytidylyltransferase
MALQFSVLKTRAITAVFFVAVMLTGLLWNQGTYILLFTVIHFGCWHEYRKLLLKIDSSYAKMNSIHHNSMQLAGWGFMLWGVNDEYRIGEIIVSQLGGSITLAALLLFVVNEWLRNKTHNHRYPLYAVCGFLYISLACFCMMLLYGNMQNQVFPGKSSLTMPLLVIAAIWINDTMAYLVGSLIGKTPLSAISPKKTLEGTLGGIVLSVAVITFFGVTRMQLAAAPVIALTTLTTLAGTAGDLLESKLKRMAGVKDSGQIMPGHGGFLDRFDSLLIAATLVGLCFYCWYGL